MPQARILTVSTHPSSNKNKTVHQCHQCEHLNPHLTHMIFDLEPRLIPICDRGPSVTQREKIQPPPISGQDVAQPQCIASHPLWLWFLSMAC